MNFDTYNQKKLWKKHVDFGKEYKHEWVEPNHQDHIRQQEAIVKMMEKMYRRKLEEEKKYNKEGSFVIKNIKLLNFRGNFHDDSVDVDFQTTIDDIIYTGSFVLLKMKFMSMKNTVRLKTIYIEGKLTKGKITVFELKNIEDT